MQRRCKDLKKIIKLQLLCAAAKQQHSQARLCDPLTSHSLKKFTWQLPIFTKELLEVACEKLIRKLWGKSLTLKQIVNRNFKSFLQKVTFLRHSFAPQLQKSNFEIYCQKNIQKLFSKSYFCQKNVPKLLGKSYWVRGRKKKNFFLHL